MNKLIAALAVASALGVASGAVAGPMQMSDNQLDQVTAGAHATATAGGFAHGTTGATSVSVTLAAEGHLHINRVATADGAAGLAISYDILRRRNGRNRDASGSRGVIRI